jgi:signal peptidase I
VVAAGAAGALHQDMSTPSTTAAPAGAPAKSLRREAAELARSLAIALLIALALHTALFQPFTIPSSSMEPGLVTGDYIVVSKFAYGWSRASFPLDPPLFRGRLFGRGPARGDVVVFRLPRDPQQTWIKRVIGLPGDRVQVQGGVVTVNGQPLARTPLGLVQDHDDPFRVAPLYRETLGGRPHLTYGGEAGRPGEDTDVYLVPAGAYLVMGDNRDNSLDGRWPAELGVGFLPADNIVGKAELVLASWRPGAALYKPWTWLDLQPGRLLRPIR